MINEWLAKSQALPLFEFYDLYIYMYSIIIIHYIYYHDCYNDNNNNHNKIQHALNFSFFWSIDGL